MFADIAQGKDEQERAERVLRWFICTLKGQYTVSLARRADEGRRGRSSVADVFRCGFVFRVTPDPK